MPLVDTGNVVRYYFDEGAHGSTTPTAVVDHSGNGYDLTEINYGSGNMAYAEVSGNRGLDSSSATGVQRARRSIDNTSDAVRDAFDGATAVTIELVVRIDSGNASGGRVFGITGRSGQNGALMIRVDGSGNMFFYFNDVAQGSITHGTSRIVLHFVYDSAQATAADRLKVAVNGGTLTQLAATISLNEAIDFGSDHDLIAFNRDNGGSFERSFNGAVEYAALYTGAFDQTTVDTNYAALNASSNTPGAAVTYLTPLTHPLTRTVLRM